MAERCALVTGATGQDGRLMTRQLLERGYRVVGTSRAPAGDASGEGGIELVACSLRDEAEIVAIVEQVEPDEVYNFAAFSTGSGMFDAPIEMTEVNGLGPVRIMEAIRRVRPQARFCQASSSEMFGPRSPAPQSEETRFDPQSPYAAAKHFAHTMIDVYRRRHGLFACSAILFNHESELRPTSFVTRKITRAAARIKRGLDDHVMLGNLEARRDWGFAGDYMAGLWLMLQQDAPADYAVATGKTHSVGDLARIAFAAVDLDYRDYVRLDPAFSRPRAEVPIVGDAAALLRLGWAPTLSFEDLIHRMVREDLRSLTQDL